MDKTIKAGIYFVAALLLYVVGANLLFIGFVLWPVVLVLMFLGLRNLYRELGDRKVKPLKYAWYVISSCYFLTILGGALLFMVNGPLFTVVYFCLPSSGLKEWGGGDSCVRMTATEARSPQLCKFVSPGSDREWCEDSANDAKLYDLALETRDVGKCKLISNRAVHFEQDACSFNVAKTTKAPEDCLPAQGLINACLKTLIEADPGSYTKERVSQLCSQASKSEERKFCYAAAATTLKDTTYCSMLDNEEEKQGCLSWAKWY